MINKSQHLFFIIRINRTLRFQKKMIFFFGININSGISFSQSTSRYILKFIRNLIRDPVKGERIYTTVNLKLFNKGHTVLFQ